ncbi:hypothetical protein [Brevibacillus laterosporus]|uniref:hypothetical protein n=1 Tax=Brevibacillus laterosporus TaxID=1465 RepID=UPI00264F44A8|nr:hypothetical protein [Brevibacillus laterosporus]MDN9012720.1 hypothetical protein [Brevibacillus laterosporus]MDO0943809.1 hypothetical protein [Brevibacillus laterosporus]
MIFYKFVPPAQKLSLIKKIMRPIVRMMGTDIGCRLESIVMPYSKCMVVEENSSVLFGGMYRKIVLRKQ